MTICSWKSMVQTHHNRTDFLDEILNCVFSLDGSSQAKMPSFIYRDSRCAKLFLIFFQYPACNFSNEGFGHIVFELDVIGRGILGNMLTAICQYGLLDGVVGIHTRHRLDERFDLLGSSAVQFSNSCLLLTNC